MSELPELPPLDVLLRGDQTTHFVLPYHEPLWRDISLYGEEKMRAYGRQCFEAGLELAAREADHWQQINTSHKCGTYIATAIRGIKAK
jgi:hypothetical protein